jgi:hypothetical protein
MGTDRVAKVVSAAHDYASSRLFAGLGISPQSIQTLEWLCGEYRRKEICVFTGAGVSFTKAKHYPSPGWWDLLLQTYGSIQPRLKPKNLCERFEKLRKKHPTAWEMASALVREARSEATFLGAMRRVLVGQTGRDMRYKRLPMTYLKHANTLNAVIAFCSCLRSIRVHPCLEPNPKVRAVLTLNYDWFLEGGATQKYNAAPFKPVASLDSREDPARLPVYHIHGYVPHDIREKPEHPLVLTVESYRKAYRPATFTSRTLEDFLGNFTTLFIGISFEDELLMRRLAVIARGNGTPDHFALMHHGSSLRLLNRLNSARVHPILYCCHDQIPSILGHVYKAGLPRDTNIPLEVKTGSKNFAKVERNQISSDECWELLLFNKP